MRLGERTLIKVENVSVERIFKIDLNHYWIGLFKARDYFI